MTAVAASVFSMAGLSGMGTMTASQRRVRCGREPAAGIEDIAAGDVAGLRGKDDPMFMDDSEGWLR